MNIPALPQAPPLSAFGGVEGLREILTDFYQRVYRDPMIGYLFAAQEMSRLIEREVEWTAQALGAEIEYRGRSLRQAHGAHPIRRGHFFRRNELLAESMRAHQLSPEATEWWCAHSAALESAILGGVARSKDCEQTVNRSSAPQSPLTLWGGES